MIQLFSDENLTKNYQNFKFLRENSPATLTQEIIRKFSIYTTIMAQHLILYPSYRDSYAQLIYQKSREDNFNNIFETN